jgi:hypothetical protein
MGTGELDLQAEAFEEEEQLDVFDAEEQAFGDGEGEAA